MIGRQSHRCALLGALQRAERGTAEVLVLEGDPGSGKSTLLDFAAGQAAPDALVLRASGHVAESDLPYAGLHQLLAPLAGELGDLPAPQASALGRALALESGRPGDRFATASALLRVLTRASEPRPVVVVVDDFGWLDPSTKQALVFAARRVEADAVALLVGVRRGTAPELDGVGSRLEVGALPAAESRELLRREFPDLSAAVAERLIERAAGLPLVLTEIPAELTADQRSGRAPLPPMLPVGSFVEGLYSSRLAALDDRTRLALLLASFEDLDAATLATALDRCDLGLADFEPAEAGHLVRIVAGRCVFTHPTVRAAIQGVVTGRQMERAHEALAACFVDDPARYARHVQGRAAVLDAEVVSALVAAARQAEQQGGLAEAAACWEGAARRTHDPDIRRAYLADAVRGHVRTGAGPRALSGLAGLIEEARDEAELARWQTVRVVTSLWTEGSLPGDSDALATLAVDLTARPAEAHLGVDLFMALATSWHIWGDYRAAKELADRVRDVRPRPELTIGQLLMCDILDAMAGEPGAGGYLRSGWADGLSDDQLGDPSMPSVFAAMTLIWIDEVDACEQVGLRFRSASDGHGQSAAPRLASRSLMARVCERRGDWDRAALEFANAQLAAIDSDFPAPYPSVTLRFAYLRAMQGRSEECRELVGRATAAARQLSPALEHLRSCALGMLHLSCGRYAEAAAELAVARAGEPDLSTSVVGYTTRFVDQFQALWHLGRADEMLAELDAFEAAGELARYPTALASAERCRALVAPEPEIDERFARAAAGYQRATLAFEVARTDLLWGQRLRRARRKGDARVRLLAADRAFDRLGADGWLAQVRSELAACGERRVAGQGLVGPLASLTPREFEIAQAAAAGASNAHVAERLFISLRTVEYHLSNVYRKVGLENRHGLADLFPVGT